jgi:SSS family solute:Na+ symporter
LHLETLDFVVVAIYAVSLLTLAQWVSREKAGHKKNTQDYFLAGRALPWWAIGASLIAANISAEQIIGMSGSAFVMGIAIGAYEWMAAITLIIVGKYLLPVFLKHKIYTMPQFLEQRFLLAGCLRIRQPDVDSLAWFAGHQYRHGTRP